MTDESSSPSTETCELQVSEMDCPSCAAKIRKAVERIDGIDDIETYPTSGRVIVSYDSSSVSVDDVSACIERAGYDVTPIDADDGSIERAEDVWLTPRAVGTAIGAVFLVAGSLLGWLLPGLDSGLATVFGATITVSDVLLVVSAAIAGAPILRNGYYSARTRSLDIHFLMSAGIVASVATHHPFEGAMLAVLFSIAELLERFSMDRARDSLRELLHLSPETATVLRNGSERTIPTSALATGDVVVVRPGEKIPVDGVVRSGGGPVDQSPITGESVPVDRGVDDEVYAGTISEGYLEIDATSTAADSTLAQIVELVRDAEREQTKREQFVERFASVYTPIVVVLAVAVATLPPLLAGASWNTWFLRGLTLLVIACPCAFVISTPVSVVSGITSAAKNGVLIKGGRHLEAVGESDVLAVDKTGTLTKGQLTVTDVLPLEGVSETAVLRRASLLERRSEHPIGAAIVDAAKAREIDHDLEDGDDGPVSEFEALPGRGVRGTIDGVTHYVGKPELFGTHTDIPRSQLEHAHRTDGGELFDGHDGNHATFESGSECANRACVDVRSDVVPRLESAGKTGILVGTQDRLLGVIGVADEIRPEAGWAISRLKDQNVRVVMLTGDNEGTARAIATAVGIDEYHAELLPEEKLEWIRRLEREGNGTAADTPNNHVAMVGDGINDAPALATATVGIAMGAAGTDTALETADVALMADDLSKLPYLYVLSRKANGVIRQNIWSSLAVKAVLAIGAPFGIVTVIHAVVIGDMGMSLGVTGNAMRLAGIEPETPDEDTERLQ